MGFSKTEIGRTFYVRNCNALYLRFYVTIQPTFVTCHETLIQFQRGIVPLQATFSPIYLLALMLEGIDFFGSVKTRRHPS